MSELILEHTKRKALFFKEILAIEPTEIALEMTKIPAGGFYMGTPEDEIERLCKEYKKEGMKNESPQHWVNVPQFFLGKYPVTQVQWRTVAGWEKVEADLNPDPARFKGDDRPVERVSWDNAKEFCARLSQRTGKIYRLPSEAEWEYACRAIFPPLERRATGDLDQWNKLHHQPFHFGETLRDDVANYAVNNVYGRVEKSKKRGETTTVGSFPANNFGIYDMHGNLYEWCEDDWHDHYENAPPDGSAWIKKSGRKKIRRGGAWDDDPSDCRSAYRSDNVRDGRSSNIGFRVACSLPGFP